MSDERFSDPSTWNIHAKPCGRVNYERLCTLPGSPVSQQAMRDQLRWVLDDKMYEGVAVKGVGQIPNARYKQRWIDHLVRHDVIAEIEPHRIRGAVNMFAVPEWWKERFRSIKETQDINIACGKETVTPCTFPSKPDITSMVNDGEYVITLDFAAWYDQFELGEQVASRMCFRHNGKCYRLCTMAMGQRQAVAVANTATERLLDFDKQSRRTERIIDNVIFAGTREAVIHDATAFIARCKEACATLNEIDVKTATASDIEQLAVRAADWGGVSLNFVDKTVKLTAKTVEKVKMSWERRHEWTCRQYAAHVGLLFWAWGIIELPMADFFPTLRFNSEMSKRMTASQPPPAYPEAAGAPTVWPENPAWDEPVAIWETVWPSLERWTNLVIDNAPRAVNPVGEPDLLMLTDASRWGWGYVSYDTRTGSVQCHGEPWSKYMVKKHGNRLGHSTFTEPEAVIRSLCHRVSTRAVDGAPPIRRIRIGTDNTVTEVAYNRGYNIASYDINRCLQRAYKLFPPSVYTIELRYVRGVDNLADGRSRGIDIASEDVRDKAPEVLRRLLGGGEGSKLS